MSYGFSIKNSIGQEIVFGEEVAMHFWGKKTFTVSRPSHTIITHRENLFNIPLSVPMICFVGVKGDAGATGVSRVIHAAGPLWASGSTHEYVVTLSGDNNTSTPIEFTVYCFVPADHFKNSQISYDYGLRLFNSKGVLAFEGSRPLLEIRDYISPSTHRGTSLGYRSATDPVKSKHFEEEYATDKTRSWVYGAVGNLDNFGPYKEVVKYTSTIYDGSEEDTLFSTVITTIDVDKYDQYPSAGNYTI